MLQIGHPDLLKVESDFPEFCGYILQMLIP